MKYTDLRCACCDKAVEPSRPDAGRPGDECTPPHDALLFISYGNYGSRVFDSVMGDEYLLVIICDDCAGKLREAGNVIHVVKNRPAVTRRHERQERWQQLDDGRAP